jgi:hypothetical protein
MIMASAEEWNTTGAPQPIAHLESADNIIGWSSDGRTLFIYRSQDMPLTFRVSRFDPATGRKELVREITPADPVGDSRGQLQQLRVHDA